MPILFNEIRTEQNLFSAWRHVKRRALNSANPKIKGEASEFEHHHQRHLRRIGDQLREGRFEFDGFEGILKDKRKRAAKGKNPRPIVIGTIKNRIVQRAILQVLQPRKIINLKEPLAKFTPREDKRLGKLNLINCSIYGVGGLMAPYGGVQPAIKLVMDAMSNGGKYFYQSDIKEFFTKIDTRPIIETIRNETNDEELTNLFAKALEVNLSNKEEILTYASLFPSGGIGVAQGSSLSAFAGNILLYDFDHELNNMNVVAVRYIDDLMLIGKTQSDLNKATRFAKEHLRTLGFELYPPSKGSDKADQGLCENAFKFLGCTLQPNKCVPSKKSIQNLAASIDKQISSSKTEILRVIEKSVPINRKLSRSATLDNIGKKVYGWEKSFSFCTDAHPFNNLDETIQKKIMDYENWVTRTLNKNKVLPNVKMQLLGIPSTEQLFREDLAKRKASQ